jgi:hypothetical protein
MNELPSPPSERGPFRSKDGTISDEPNVPTCQHYYLHKERFMEIPSGHSHNSLQIMVLNPFHLEIVPNPCTEIALEKEMNSILIQTKRT